MAFVNNASVAHYDATGLKTKPDSLPSIGLPSGKDVAECTLKCFGENFFNIVGHDVARWAKQTNICSRTIPIHCQSTKGSPCYRDVIEDIHQPQIGDSTANKCFLTCLAKSAIKNLPGIGQGLPDVQPGTFDWSMRGDLGVACDGKRVRWWFMTVIEVENKYGQKVTDKTIVEAGECAKGGQSWCDCCRKM